MALQGIWSGTISFSLVAIPVQLVRAVTPGRISFHLLHKDDYAPLKRRMYCLGHQAPVPSEEIIRGYEIEPDRFLPITNEELESLTPERSRTIEIVEFIDMDEVDPLYYDHPYFLVPLKGGEKSYRLLAEVMAQTNRAGLARFVLSEREYLVAVKSTEGALTLITLHYGEEILPVGDFASKPGQATAAGKKRIKESIGRMMTGFDPGKYADGRRKRILELLERKARESAPVKAPARAVAEEEGPPDLVATLENIMREVKKSR